MQWRTEGGGFKPPSPRNSEGPPKSCQTQPDLKTIKKLLNLGRQHPKVFGKKSSKILKLPSARNCFARWFKYDRDWCRQIYTQVVPVIFEPPCTFAMTNKLVVTTNSHNVPKIKKILLYEMKFLVPNYSCLQLTAPDPRSLCPLSSTEFVEPPPEHCINVLIFMWSTRNSCQNLMKLELSKNNQI